MRNNKLPLNTKIILFLLLILAAVFRFYNLNWDEGHFFHSDERNIAMGVANLVFFSQMDPKFYAYGGFLIYLYKITADIAGSLLSMPTLAIDWAYINVLGRYYSAFFSTMTIIPLFLLAQKVFNKKTALISVFFYAICVSSIQTAHFSITENLLSFIIVTLTLLSILYYEKSSLKIIMITGILLGLAVGTKTTGLSFFLIPLSALSLSLLQKKTSFKKVFTHLLFLIFLALFVFTLTSPFTFLNWEDFYRSMKFENEVVLGINPVVYTLQFTGTPSYLYQLSNLFWQVGPFFLFCLFGIFSVGKNIIQKRNPYIILAFIFPLIYFLYVGSWHTKFIRYMIPTIPFFILLGASFLDDFSKKFQKIGYLALILFIFSSTLYTLSFFSIYTRPQTRIAASEWIYKNIPHNSIILNEHWDEGLPIPRISGSPDNYQIHQLTLYEPDNPEKITYYSDMISTAEYITITTRRLHGTLIRLSDKYPVTSVYYRLLFEGKLGYQKVAEFSSYPQLFGIILNDDLAEETFQVYDHPTSLIFKNVQKKSSAEIELIFKESVRF